MGNLKQRNEIDIHNEFCRAVQNAKEEYYREFCKEDKESFFTMVIEKDSFLSAGTDSWM